MPSRLYDKFGNRTDMRIDARPRNVEYEEGTGPGTGRTARRVDPSVGSSAGNRSANLGGGLDAFYLAQRDKTRSMGDINREASIARENGLMYNPRLGGYTNNSMYNRNMANPYSMMGQQQPQQPQATVLTEPQQEWARLAQAKQSGAGALGKIGEKMANVNSNPMFGAGLQAVGTAVNAAMSPSFSANPYAGTRQQNIANAKTAGMFDNIQAEYNRRNEAQGLQMDEDGNITKSPAIAAKEISEGKQMVSDFNRGVDRGKGGNTVSSRYGSGRSTFGIFGPGKPQSMVKDDLDKEEVQKSKGMTGGSSVLSQNQTGKTAIPPNPLIKKKDNTNTSLNSSKEEAKSRGSDEVSKEKQVSRKEAFDEKYYYNKNPDGKFFLLEDRGEIVAVDENGKMTFFPYGDDPEGAVRDYRLYLKAIEDPMAKGDTLKANEYRNMLWRIYVLGAPQDAQIRLFKEKFPDK